MGISVLFFAAWDSAAVQLQYQTSFGDTRKGDMGTVPAGCPKALLPI
jgi:hypothetical protein